MTIPFLTVKPKSIKLKVSPRFPSRLFGGTGIDIIKTNGNYTVDLAYEEFPPFVTMPVAPNLYVLIYDTDRNAYYLVKESAFFGVPEAPTDGKTYGRLNGTWSAALPIGGGTLTGPLILNADPSTALGAATKAYVDAHAGGGGLTPATTAQYLNNTPSLALVTDQVWAAAGIVSLTDAATIAVDMSTFINATVTLAGNRTLGTPSNAKAGQTGVIQIVQDTTGSRTLTYGANWKFAGGTLPVLTTTANAVDLLFYQVISSTFIFATLISNVTAGISTQAAAFLARTSGLDSTHTNAYIALINGLVADGIWSKLDVLHIYATQTSANALLNLVSTSYNAVIHGAPTFTTDRGFTGTDGSTTIYIDTTFNASTAVSPQFVQNSAHLSLWNINNPAGGMNNPALGTWSPGSGNGNFAQPQNTSGNCVLKCNGNNQLDSITGSGTGHHVANRSGANARDGYRNGVNIQSITSGANSGSNAVQNGNIIAIGVNNLDTSTPTGSGFQLAMISIGGSLSATDVTNFYNRLRTYMTVVGVP